MSICERAGLSMRGRVCTTLSDYLALTKPRTIHLVVGAVPALLLADRGVVPLVADPQHTDRLDALHDRRRQHAQLRRGRRHRQADEAYRGPAAGARCDLDPPCAGVRVGAHRRLVRVAVVDHDPAGGSAGGGHGGRSTCSSTRWWIKRRSSHNVLWGGAANAMPVLIGWSAVTGTIGWQALVMFAIIFFWTPPHSWALAMRQRG